MLCYPGKLWQKNIQNTCRYLTLIFNLIFQTCISANRFLIHENRYDEFIAKFSEKIKLLKVGDGAEAGVTVGPLINKAQLAKVSALVDYFTFNLYVFDDNFFLK